MIDVAEPRRFDGFGRFVLGPAREPRRTELLLPGDNATARRMLRRYCPAAPGIYGMIGDNDELIYVGKSKSLRDRLLSYFSAAARDEKGGRIVDHALRLAWEPAPHEFVALVRELELIRAWQPRFNVKGRAERFRRTYLCLSPGPAPQVHLAARPAAAENILFGPIAATRRCRHVVGLVNNCFGLRDCPQRVPMIFADQRELFPQLHAAACMRHELGDCLGPCAAACTRAQYRQHVRQAQEFLSGRNRSVLQRLESTMRDAAAQQQFERAGAIRDRWLGLTELDDHLRQLRHVCRHYRFVYPLPGYGRRELWYFVVRGQVVGCTRAPHSPQSAERCLALLNAVFSRPSALSQREMPEDLDATMLVILWFRRHPEELQHTLTPDAAMRLADEQARAVVVRRKRVVA